MKQNTSKKEAGAHLTTKSNAASDLTIRTPAEHKMLSLRRVE